MPTWYISCNTVNFHLHIVRSLDQINSWHYYYQQQIEAKTSSHLVLVFLTSQKTLSWGRSGPITPEAPGRLGSQLNTLSCTQALWRLVHWGWRQVVRSHGAEKKKPCLKANAVPMLCEKPALLKRKLPAVKSQPNKRKHQLMRTCGIEGKLARHLPN